MPDNKKDPISLQEKRGRVRSTGSRERRSYIRTGASVPIVLHLKEKGADEEIKAYARNISATGIMFESDRELPVGVEASINLNAPDTSNPVHCTGRIIWSTPISQTKKFHCGIEFLSIEEDNKNTFLKFLCDAIYKSDKNA